MKARRPLLLLADRELSWSLPLRERLAQRGLRIEQVTTAQELLERVTDQLPELVILGEGLDELGVWLLGSLVLERSPGTRIIRALPSDGSPATEGAGTPSDVLCSLTRRASADDWVGVITRLLKGASPETPASRLPLVVCVDDDETFLHGLARILGRRGYRVLWYTEPELALEEFPLVKPDLMILDVLMPGLSGFEVLSELRQYYSAELPVILLSAKEDDAGIAEGRRLGAACFLAKPCAPEILLEAVRCQMPFSDPAEEPKPVGKAVLPGEKSERG